MNYKPFMSENEINLITSYLSEDDIFLEWGSGGSTVYFSKYVKEYYSIEHNKEWYDKINEIKPNNVNLHLIEINTGNTFEYKYGSKKEDYEEYINYIDKIGVEKYDKVLIDGRARQWCAEKLINYIDKNSIIFIHDFWNRERYNSVLKYYNVIDSIKDTPQTLAIFKLK